jgi:sec-independent protein translocase protein TatA
VELVTPWHLALIVLAFVLLFGSRRLPDAARSLGRSMRILRSELREPAADEPTPAARPAADLEAQARAEEARAAELRERARRLAADPDGER